MTLPVKIYKVKFKILLHFFFLCVKIHFNIGYQGADDR